MRQGLIVVGLLLLVAGLAWPWIARLGLGHLPGDVRIERPGFGLYLPLGSSLVVSIVLTLALWLWRR
jgi:membrane protein implicated in regulation of membrane protease activity